MPASEKKASLNSEELFKKARQVLAGGISHELRYAAPYPQYIARAKGSRMWDVEGKEYVDFGMGSASMLLGHGHPDVVKAIQTQVENGVFHANCHEGEVEWGLLVQGMFPASERIRFVASGTEATLLAIRIARAFSGKSKVLRFETQYNGWHDYVTVGTAEPYNESPSLGLPPEAISSTVVVPTDAARVEDALKKNPDIGTIICEASGASYGTVPLSHQFLRDLRALADKYKCVFILDEVISGFRWSPGGIQALSGVKPDMTTYAKVLTGGLPGGAVGGREEVMQLLDPTVKFKGKQPGVTHKGTFNGNPLVAAGAVAALNIIKTGKPQKHADAMAKKLRDGMQKTLDEHQVAGVVYGESSTFHLYFGKVDQRGLAGLTAAQFKGVPKETVKAFRKGLRTRGADLMSYLGGVTSLAHTDDDIGRMLDIFKSTMQDLIKEGLVGRA